MEKEAREVVTDWFREQWPNSTNLDPHVDCDYKKLTKQIAKALAMVQSEREKATQEQCALYLDQLARNHPHVADAYRHAAYNLRAQTTETLAALATPPGA